MKEAWKNNNTLIKFKEATPIEQRDEIADFQRSYDAKWKEPGSRSVEFNQKLVDRKVSRIINSINNHVKKCKSSLHIDKAVFVPAEQLVGYETTFTKDKAITIVMDLDLIDMFNSGEEATDAADVTEGNEFKYLNIIPDAADYVLDTDICSIDELEDYLNDLIWVDYQLVIPASDIPDKRILFELLGKISKFCASDDSLYDVSIRAEASTKNLSKWVDIKDLRELSKYPAIQNWGGDNYIVIDFRQDATYHPGLNGIIPSVQKSFDEFYKIAKK